MSERTRLRGLLGAATVLAGLALGVPAWAARSDAALIDSPVPPEPDTATVEGASRVLANPLNQPVTGAAISPTIVGGQHPLSLESLQAARPGVNPSGEMGGARGEALHEAALSYGARGGLAARGFAINEILRRYEAKLNSSYDFRSLVVQVGRGQTLMRPPIVTEAQMAFALGDAQLGCCSRLVYFLNRQLAGFRRIETLWSQSSGVVARNGLVAPETWPG